MWGAPGSAATGGSCAPGSGEGFPHHPPARPGGAAQTVCPGCVRVERGHEAGARSGTRSEAAVEWARRTGGSAGAGGQTEVCEGVWEEEELRDYLVWRAAGAEHCGRLERVCWAEAAALGGSG